MRYSRWLNRGQGEGGHVWANRSYSAPMDRHASVGGAQVRGAEPRPRDLRWRPRSTRGRAHPRTSAPPQTSPSPGDCRSTCRPSVMSGPSGCEQVCRRHPSPPFATARAPGGHFGSREFVARLEAQAGRRLAPRRPGPGDGSEVCGGAGTRQRICCGCLLPASEPRRANESHEPEGPRLGRCIASPRSWVVRRRRGTGTGNASLGRVCIGWGVPRVLWAESGPGGQAQPAVGRAAMSATRRRTPVGRSVGSRGYGREHSPGDAPATRAREDQTRPAVRPL